MNRRAASRVLAAFAIASCAAAFAWAGAAGGVFRGLRLQASDAMFPSGATDPRIVVVGVDAEAITAVGERWPWPRELHGRILRNLTDARMVVYDVVFDPAAPGDGDLARALRRNGRVILGASFGDLFATDEGLLKAREAVLPVPRLAEAGLDTGHTNVAPDPADGVVRALPLLVEAPVDPFPSLAFAAYRHVEGLHGPVTVRPQGIQVGGRLIPTSPQGLLEINYTEMLDQRSAKVPYLSAADVLTGRRGPDAIEGKIVIVGVTDPGLGDHRLTPVAKAGGMAGVFVHANALNTLLTRSYLTMASPPHTAAWTFGLVFLAAAMALTVNVWMAAFGALVAWTGHLVLAFVRIDQGFVADLVYPSLGMVGGFGAALAVGYLSEAKGRRLVTGLLTRYLPEPVARQLIDRRGREPARADQRREITVLFCDLRGFTATAESMRPDAVREMLDVYYEITTAIVKVHRGTLMQYVGDEVFAIFGAPETDPNSAMSAYRCAIAFQLAGERINDRLRERRLPSIAYGIGLYVGEAVVAHVGSELRRQYSVVGDTVNCGARLCSAAGPGEVVMSSEVYRRAGSPADAAPLGPLDLKGLTRDLEPMVVRPAADTAERR